MSTTTILPTLNKLKINNRSCLDANNYTVWVAGFMQKSGRVSDFYTLQSDGGFATASNATHVKFINVSGGLAENVPDIASSGNNRLFFTVTKASTTPYEYPLNGYTAYPFKDAPGVAPSGPYDIFEFGLKAHYEVSAVDSFGINPSFTVSGDKSVYGATVPRSIIGETFKSFMQKDDNYLSYEQLLLSSLTGTGYPEVIKIQFSAAVSPKDWLAIYPSASGLSGYWKKTSDAFFEKGNQVNFYLNGATVGSCSGKGNGTHYTLDGPDSLSTTIPKSYFDGDKHSYRLCTQ